MKKRWKKWKKKTRDKVRKQNEKKVKDTKSKKKRRKNEKKEKRTKCKLHWPDFCGRSWSPKNCINLLHSVHIYVAQTTEKKSVVFKENKLPEQGESSKMNSGYDYFS